MFLKIVKNDFVRKKVITVAILIFTIMAVVLGASATNIIATLIQSMTELKKCSVPSDFTQMHAGEYNQEDIDKFVSEQQNNISMQETMELLNVDGGNIHFRENETMSGTIQDILFVIQNKKFDFIVDLNNKKLDIKEGNVAVPVYFMKEHNLKIGDKITIKTDGYEKEFIISDYARDYEMNSALTSSKRFVVNELDYNEMIRSHIGEKEYLIQFKLNENVDVDTIQATYTEASLPANGPAISVNMFTLFNAMSDATVAMIIILISILLIIIASICIRLTFVATIDEDLREIGVMKAMGIPKNDIKKVYLSKYRVIAIVSGIIGYLLSFIVVNLFNGNMKLYISSDLSGGLKYLLSLIAPVFVYFMIIMYCKKVLRRIDKISAVEALRSDINESSKNRKYTFSLSQNRFFSTNVYMGLRDVFKRFKLYRLLVFIFIMCMFIVILPINLYNTMTSPEFCTYMGVGKCDMRVDFRRTDTITEDFNEFKEELKRDLEVEKYASYITCSYPVKNNENSWDYINIETGDFSVFPLNYLEGKAPKDNREIALSYANASEDGLNKKVGDEIVVKVNGSEKIMKVSGIYQDITNGGKTAKADTSLGLNENSVLWYIVNINLASNVDIRSKINVYQNRYNTAQVNDIEEYTKQSLSDMISYMEVMVIGGIAISLVIVTLITTLFTNMLLSKDISQIAIMKSMGLTSKNIKHQYMAGTFLILIVGIIFGVVASKYLGEFLVTMAMSSMGAAKIQFINVGWQTWIICPLVFIVVVGLTISACCKVTMKEDLSVVLRS